VLALFHQMCAHVTYARLPYAIVAVALEMLGMLLCHSADLHTIGAADPEACSDGTVSLECALMWYGRAAVSVNATYVISIVCVLVSHMILTLCAPPGASPRSFESAQTNLAVTPCDEVTSTADIASPVSEKVPEVAVECETISAADSLAVYLLGILAALAYVFIQNFSLGVLLSITVVPTLLTASWAVLYSGDSALCVRRVRGAVLAVLALLHSPLGLKLAAYLISSMR
jgi:hypothetical protein